MSYTISWPVDGLYWEAMATDLMEARGWAIGESRRHGHATITDRTGLVETWVEGRIWHDPRTGGTE